MYVSVNVMTVKLWNLIKTLSQVDIKYKKQMFTETSTNTYINTSPDTRLQFKEFLQNYLIFQRCKTLT